ncbi:MAG: hypothetical protein KF912_05235 [Phycisphaeraceae bacterium]|nr:hypothetical protein [Phycisphaeraceae bacterium]MBX3366703.1 hypothetical protein [Phycisphaeraceae bacterium]QYK47396.1 MAG: hypothetical protein KF838_11465 [Phycisphaeraceae bacterium]
MAKKKTKTKRAVSKKSTKKSTKKAAKKVRGKTTAAKTTAMKWSLSKPSPTKTPVVRTKQTVKSGGVSDEAVLRKTGHGWEHWMAVLDAFDVKRHGHKAAAEHLHAEHGVDEWWSQMVTVGYEQKRGLRQLRQKADGFSASASRTIGAGISRVLDAFEDKAQAARWLPEGVVVHKVTRPPMKDGRPTKPGSARMTWSDRTKTLSAWISEKSAKDGAVKTVVQVQHDKLPDAQTCDQMRAMWSERMDVLRGTLERGDRDWATGNGRSRDS